MTTEEVLNLIEHLTATGYQHMDVSHEGTHILLSNTTMVQTVPQGTPSPQTTSSPVTSVQQGQAIETQQQVSDRQSSNKEADKDTSANVKVESQEGILIESPIVGTYYSAPTPEEDDFVSVGQQVKKGDVLCIIEAMKLMNEIEADRDGTILEILVTNEQGVEFGQPLFRIG